MERSILISLVAFLLFSVLENVISTVVGPTLIFYILSVGGTNEDYGLTTSAVCLGATLMMFYFGKWVDRNGNKYQAPLGLAFILGIIGSVVYFLADILPSGWGVNAILFGRFVQGMGGAGKTLTRSWIATAVPLENQKTVFSILAIVGIAGQAIGPLMNTLVAEIDLSVPITPSYSIHINPYNSVGLLVALNEVLLWIIVALFVKDPPPRKEKSLASATEAEPVSEAGLYDILNAMTHFDIFFPLIQRFVIVSNFALFGISIAPVAANMLHWSPVNISTLSAVSSGFTFVGMGITLYLSMIKTSDFIMILVGDLIFVISGAMTYFSWREDTATALSFSIPIFLTSIVYPFAGPANQSSFNKAVFSRPELAGSIGVLQSIYTQFATIAGIVAPMFTTSYVLRNPEDISMSSPYELSQWALFVPISSFLLILGLLYEEFVLGKNELGLLADKAKEAEDMVRPDETSKLVVDKKSKSTRLSVVEIDQVFSPKYEADRRMSSEITINGVGIINPFETATDAELTKKISQDKKEWEHLLRLDEELDDVEMEE
mmetsp:Transcript_19184/g.31432  ORF Transcript_19184/g.31432 Transcript_19184/m.31432 type:complete len:547 (-) Transcript_19184:92-1732(-)